LTHYVYTHASQSSTGSSVGPTSSDRESRRTANIGVEGFGQPRTLSPNGEPRGLNARTISLSSDKPVAHRPGLFQRGSSYTNTPPTALSPTLFQSSRERDRFGTGIQGGVLSGVAAIPSARRRKDSETGAGENFQERVYNEYKRISLILKPFLTSDSLRSPRAPLDAEHQWEQRRTNDAFTSARNRSSRTVHDEGTGVGASSGTTEMIETWSRFGGRRERAPGEGPIGPPADHSGGFAKFAGYDRKVSFIIDDFTWHVWSKARFADFFFSGSA
jgi:PERQ amino acid-rich with GYF domain-containing protein